MTPATLNEFINISCGTTDDEFPQSRKLILINAFKDTFASDIAKCNEDIFGMVFTDNLIAGQRQYPLSYEILAIKGFEAKLDGANWQWLREFDLNSMRKPTDEADIIANYSGKKAEFDMFDRSVKIYSESPIVDVSGGLKLWAIIYPAEIANLTEAAIDMSINPTTISHGFPRQFHELLGRRVAIHWKTSQDRPKTLNEKELKFDADYERALKNFTGGNLDRSIIRTAPVLTGGNL